MTMTPSWLRIISISLGYAVLFDLSLILILAAASSEQKPGPFFFLAL